MVRTQKAEAEFYVARSSGTYRIKGKVYDYIRGTAYPRNHPLLAVIPERFTPLVPNGDIVPRVIA